MGNTRKVGREPKERSEHSPGREAAGERAKKEPNPFVTHENDFRSEDRRDSLERKAKSKSPKAREVSPKTSPKPSPKTSPKPSPKTSVSDKKKESKASTSRESIPQAKKGTNASLEAPVHTPEAPPKAVTKMQHLSMDFHDGHLQEFESFSKPSVPAGSTASQDVIYNDYINDKLAIIMATNESNQSIKGLDTPDRRSLGAHPEAVSHLRESQAVHPPPEPHPQQHLPIHPHEPSGKTPSFQTPKDLRESAAHSGEDLHSPDIVPENPEHSAFHFESAKEGEASDQEASARGSVPVIRVQDVDQNEAAEAVEPQEQRASISGADVPVDFDE